MIKFIGCPDSNFRAGRPFGFRPEAIVIHVMDGSFEAGESVFRDPSSHKSAHYGISRDGEIHQYVDENDTAFHAGIVINPSWTLLKPRVNPNFYTIGIEHQGGQDDVWPQAQIEASAMLVGQIAARWGINLDDSHVIRHHQIRASKTCPGNWLEIGEILRRVPTDKALSAAAATSTTGVVHASGGAGEMKVIEAAATATATTMPVAVVVTPKLMVVRTIRNVNLRRSRPSTTAQVVRIIPAHTEVAAAKYETGEPVNANAYWYADVHGNYFWAGATNVPDPTPVAV
jgi:N-acetylmuramoyl-L-alanine amidase CwlA